MKSASNPVAAPSTRTSSDDETNQYVGKLDVVGDHSTRRHLDLQPIGQVVLAKKARREQRPKTVQNEEQPDQYQPEPILGSTRHHNHPSHHVTIQEVGRIDPRCATSAPPRLGPKDRVFVRSIPEVKELG